jgi:hypothetical protein
MGEHEVNDKRTRPTQTLQQKPTNKKKGCGCGKRKEK